MNASIIICSYNRADSLAITLKTLTEQVTHDLSWEIIVVDNNSSDHTKLIVESAAVSDESIRYIFEPQQGLSYARNKGVSVAQGDIILFTDDDVRAAPDWLQTIVDSMADTKCMACGGYIEPIWQTPPPYWLTDIFYGFLAINMDETGPKVITQTDRMPFGANMAFRKEVFVSYAGFDVERGRKGDDLASGEDSNMFLRVVKAGGSVMYFPGARVKHEINSTRLNKRYFRRWRLQVSRNIAMTVGFPGNCRVFGIPLYLFYQSVKSVFKAGIGYITLPPDEAFRREMIVWHFIGTIDGLLKKHLKLRNASM